MLQKVKKKSSLKRKNPERQCIWYREKYYFSNIQRLLFIVEKLKIQIIKTNKNQSTN